MPVRHFPNFDAKSLLLGALKEALPEFYELKGVVQNSKWHPNESVFNHTLEVLQKLDDYVGSIPKESSGIQEMLSSNLEGVGKYTRHGLLRIAALLHDVSKKETLSMDEDKTSFEGHEVAGAAKVATILDRFDLSDKERNFVIRLVRTHGKVHDIAGPACVEKETEWKRLAAAEEGFQESEAEVLLLVIADTMGSFLPKIDASEFSSRMIFLEKKLKKALIKNRLQ
jgi:putative nucleotidyltransferase with HDIG domain